MVKRIKRLRTRGVGIIIRQLTDDYNVSQVYTLRFSRGRRVRVYREHFHNMEDAKSTARAIAKELSRLDSWRGGLW